MNTNYPTLKLQNQSQDKIPCNKEGERHSKEGSLEERRNEAGFRSTKAGSAMGIYHRRPSSPGTPAWKDSEHLLRESRPSSISSQRIRGPLDILMVGRPQESVCLSKAHFLYSSECWQGRTFEFHFSFCLIIFPFPPPEWCPSIWEVQ